MTLTKLGHATLSKDASVAIQHKLGSNVFNPRLQVMTNIFSIQLIGLHYADFCSVVLHEITSLKKILRQLHCLHP